MNLLKSKLSVAIAAGILSGPALAATINCTLTPANSVITQGETLQLAATCEGGPLASITWKQGTTALTGAVPLSGDTSKPIYYTTPAGEPGDFIFTVLGDPLNGTDTFGTSSEARVLINATATAFGDTTTTPSSPTTPVDAACGQAAINGTAVQSMPTNGQQCDLSKGKPALAITGPSSYSWSCISLTGGAEANCYVPRGISYTVTASAGAHGTITPSGSQSVNSNTTTSFTVTPTTGYNIASVTGCSGSLSGSTYTYTTGAITGACSVSATFAAQASSYTVTPTAGTGGTISPNTPQTVNANGTTSFTVAANSGYTVSGVTGCGVTLTNGTYTTGAITSACTVAASFAAQQVQAGSGSDPGIGSGLWVPPNTTNRVVADQSGSSIQHLTSYVPGCLNGLYITTASASGCGGTASYTGTISGTNYTFAFGSGKVLTLRYKSKSTAGTSVKYFTLASGDGGNVGQSVKVWLSTNPAATYDATSAACKSTSTTQPYVLTGPGYCPVTPNTTYYLSMSIDTACTTCRYKVEEGASDFQ